MARVTVEDCLKRVDNRFELIHLASKRVEQLRRGAVPLVYSPKNKEVVIALREIAAGEVMPGVLGEELPPIEYFQPEPRYLIEDDEDLELEVEAKAVTVEQEAAEPEESEPEEAGPEESEAKEAEAKEAEEPETDKPEEGEPQQ